MAGATAVPAGEITATSGPAGLGTAVNGGTGCTAGACLVTGGTRAGGNLFHRFDAFDTRGAIGGVRFQNRGFNTLVVGVLSPTFIDKPVALGAPGNLFWLSPAGITLQAGGQFQNVTNLTLSTATGLRIGSGLFDVRNTTAQQAGLLSGAPLPGGAGLVSEAATLGGLGLLNNGDLSIDGGLLTVDRSLLLDAKGGNVLLGGAQPLAAQSVAVLGKHIKLRSDIRTTGMGSNVLLEATEKITIDSPLVSIFSEGDQIYRGNVSINANNLFALRTDPSGSGGIGFFGRVDGPGSLQVDLGSRLGRLVFNREVGASAPLNSLVVGSSRSRLGRTFINANTTTLGNQLYFNDASIGVKGVGVFTNNGFDTAPFDLSGQSNSGLESDSTVITPAQIDGWDVYLGPLVFGLNPQASSSRVDGMRVPNDTRNVLDIEAGANSRVGQGNAIPLAPCFDNCGSNQTRTLRVRSSTLTGDSTPGNTQSLLLETGNLFCNAGSCIIMGPYVVSKGTVFLGPGDTVTFKWTASGADDDYNVNAFLLEPSTGRTISLLNSSGGSVPEAWNQGGGIDNVLQQYNTSADRIGSWSKDNTNSGWITSAVTLAPSDAIGNYKFVYATGSYDGTGGRLVGASMQVDSIEVSSFLPLNLFSPDPLPAALQLTTTGAGSSINFAGNLENRTALSLQSQSSIVIGSLGGSGSIAANPQAVILGAVPPPSPPAGPATPTFVERFNANPQDVILSATAPPSLNAADQARAAADTTAFADIFNQANQPILPPWSSQPSLTYATGLATPAAPAQLVDNLNPADPAAAESSPSSVGGGSKSETLIASIAALPISLSQNQLWEVEAQRSDDVTASLPAVKRPACAMSEVTTAALQSKLQAAQRQIRGRPGERFKAYQPAILNLAFTQRQGTGSGAATADQAFLDLTLITSQGQPESQRVQLSLERFRTLLKSFYNQVASREPYDPADPSSPARQLHGALVAPIEAELQARGITSLLISTDRGLHAVPFAALHDGSSSFGERYAFSVTPSLLFTCLNPPKAESSRLLAAGASSFQGLAALPLVRQEIDGIAAQRPADAFLNQLFTPSVLLHQAAEARYDRVHVATHAEFLPGDPKYGLIHTGAGIVSFQEFARMRDRREGDLLDLFSLSACRTAVGDSDAEFGFAGLALQAGARSAIGTLWYVDDAATSAAFLQLYRYFDQGFPKAEALRALRQDLIANRIRLDGNRVLAPDGTTLLKDLSIAQSQNIRAGLSHPYFWAAISLLGSPW